jgi:hypothetical protein
MATPPITVRLPIRLHSLFRRTVALMKSDPPFTAALLDLVEGATDRSLSAVEGLDLDLRFRQLDAKVGRLERLSRPKGGTGSKDTRTSGTASTQTRNHSPAGGLSRNPRNRHAGQGGPQRGSPGPRAGGGTTVLSAPRALAKRLADVRLRTPEGGTRPMTRAEMERRIMEELGVPRGPAQSASTWAVRTYDPDNPERRTHRPPVARTIGPALVMKMRSLKAKGLSEKQIATRLGGDVKTVRKYLHRR